MATTNHPRTVPAPSDHVDNGDGTLSLNPDTVIKYGDGTISLEDAS